MVLLILLLDIRPGQSFTAACNQFFRNSINFEIVYYQDIFGGLSGGNSILKPATVLTHFFPEYIWIELIENPKDTDFLHNFYLPPTLSPLPPPSFFLGIYFSVNHTVMLFASKGLFYHSNGYLMDLDFCIFPPWYQYHLDFLSHNLKHQGDKSSEKLLHFTVLKELKSCLPILDVNILHYILYYKAKRWYATSMQWKKCLII